MAERVKIDDTYTYVFDGGVVSILRHGDPWLGGSRADFPGAKAWIAAANEIADLRTKVERRLESEVTRLTLNLITESDELDERNAGAIVWDKDGDPWMRMYDGTWFSQLPGATAPISSTTLVVEWGPLRRHEP